VKRGQTGWQSVSEQTCSEQLQMSRFALIL
jgi:hypothetical protein